MQATTTGPGLSQAQLARVDKLLDELLELPEEQRLATLDTRSGESEVVRNEVASLLRSMRSASSFLRAPLKLAGGDAPTDLPPGTYIGTWRVVRLIGRGGMGEVYEAERASGDFQQRVAIKVLQADSDTQRQRFQAERQILARFDHPGIARLHDGGVTCDGRPFMVMEYAEGEPITQYCAAHRLDLRQRLLLFLRVCDAVAYAHRNLIVHRDLKPSNILVTAAGDIKLLDFGIAKPLDARQAQLTQLSAVPLTPTCAAPEQLKGEPITTATDVYALGLLLFELLTGKHPWLRPDVLVLQALRAVLQQDAPQVSSAAQDNPLAPVPARLLRGDLDAIVARALRIDPADRYATVDALRLDVGHYLDGEPVVARAGARLYSLRRLLRRYRWPVAAVAAIILSLAGGLSVAAWQAHRAALERDAARRDASREEAVRDNLTRLFRDALASQSAGAPTAKSMIDTSAQRVLREYRDQPQLAGAIVLTLADLYGELNDPTGAWTLLDGFIGQAGPGVDPAVLADARQKLANIELLRGNLPRATQLIGQAEAFWATVPGRYGEERLEEQVVRARVQRAHGDLDGSIATLRRAIGQREQLSGHNHRETASLYNSLAITLAATNRLPEALDAYHQTTAIYSALGLADTLDGLIAVGNTGTLELRMGHLREAEALLKNAIDRERALGGDSAAVAAAMGYYGRALALTNRAALAVTVLRTASDMAARYTGPVSPVTLQDRLFLGEALTQQGADTEADALLASTRQAAAQQYGAGHALPLRLDLAQERLAIMRGAIAATLPALQDTVTAMRRLGPSGESHLAQGLLTLGELQLRLHQPAEAQRSLREAVALREKGPPDSWEIPQARERLGEALAATGEPQAAAMLRDASRALESALGHSHPESARARNGLAAAIQPPPGVSL